VLKTAATTLPSYWACFASSALILLVISEPAAALFRIFRY